MRDLEATSIFWDPPTTDHSNKRDRKDFEQARPTKFRTTNSLSGDTQPNASSPIILRTRRQKQQTLPAQLSLSSTTNILLTGSVVATMRRLVLDVRDLAGVVPAGS